MTSTLTFFMSTFWLKSGGNLVCFSSFASTLDAMAGNRNSTVERGEKDIMLMEEQEGILLATGVRPHLFVKDQVFRS
jgi:hypothetical protein